MECTDDVACQLLLSLSSRSDKGTPRKNTRKRRQPCDGTEFECKTCNRRFSSFQALGGHRTGHKRAKFVHRVFDDRRDNNNYNYGPHDQKPDRMKSHLHRCTICGEGFSMGQALGGHMRRHRADTIADSELNMPVPSLEECGRSGDFSGLPRNSSHIRLLELFV